jgi:hypothetical protein
LHREVRLLVRQVVVRQRRVPVPLAAGFWEHSAVR